MGNRADSNFELKTRIVALMGPLDEEGALKLARACEALEAKDFSRAARLVECAAFELRKKKECANSRMELLYMAGELHMMSGHRFKEILARKCAGTAAWIGDGLGMKKSGVLS